MSLTCPVFCGSRPFASARDDGSADEHIAETRPRAYARDPVMRGEALRERARELPFAREEDPVPRHEYVVEEYLRRSLAVTRGERRARLPGPSGLARDELDSLRIYGDRERHRVVLVLRRHAASGEDYYFVRVRRARDYRLDAPHRNAAVVAPDDAEVEVGVVLLVGAFRAVALGVRHGDARGEVGVLEVFEIREELYVIFRAEVEVYVVGRFVEGV